MSINLTQDNKTVVPGSSLKVRTEKGSKSLKWGFNEPMGIYSARLENLSKFWLSHGYKVGLATISTFREGKVEFHFENKENRDIGVIYKDDHFLLVTEPAGSNVAKENHRQPCYLAINALLKLAGTKV